MFRLLLLTLLDNSIVDWILIQKAKKARKEGKLLEAYYLLQDIDTKVAKALRQDIKGKLENV